METLKNHLGQMSVRNAGQLPAALTAAPPAALETNKTSPTSNSLWLKAIHCIS
jgi:hypothetical protein